MNESDVPEVTAPPVSDVENEEKRSEAAALATLVVPVLTQQPSGTPALEAEEVAEEAPVALEDAARVVVIFVEAHRTIGDADLAAAIADVKAALDA
jgi:hypothetical protein